MTIAISGAIQQKFKNAIPMNLKKVAQQKMKNAPAKSKEKKVAK